VYDARVTYFKYFRVPNMLVSSLFMLTYLFSLFLNITTEFYCNVIYLKMRTAQDIRGYRFVKLYYVTETNKTCGLHEGNIVTISVSLCFCIFFNPFLFASCTCTFSKWWNTKKGVKRSAQ
jgi:hypothetical protein